jgi:hypothetical protein
MGKGGVRLKLRMDFRRWSQAVDSESLPLVREWLADCEERIDAAADEFWRPFLEGVPEQDALPFAGLLPRYAAPSRQYGSSPGQQALATLRALSGETDPP